MKLLINAFTKHSMQVFCCICTVLLTFSKTKAQVLLTESFNYTQNTLLSGNKMTEQTSFLYAWTIKIELTYNNNLANINR